MLETLEYSTETLIFNGVLFFMWLSFTWETYLSLRQKKVYESSTTVPVEVKAVLDDETFQKARAYGLDKAKYGLFKSSFDMFLLTIFLLVNGIRWLWGLSGTCIDRLGYTQENDIIQSLMFMFISNTLSTIIGLPFSIYCTFVLEEKHGFNKQTAWFFTKDRIKGFIVGQIIALPIVGGLIWVIKWGGDWFFIYVWLFSSAIIFILMTAYPALIAPLFDKYTQLPEGELRDKIEALASKIKFPLTKLYVVEGSKRSTHSNAYLYGLFNNKRIVLFDTLIQGYVSAEEKERKEKEEKELDNKEETEDKSKDKSSGCTDDEVVAVLGHELGHWKLNHMAKNVVISEVSLLFMFGVFGLLYKYSALYHAFGFYSSQPVLIGLVIIIQFVFAPYHEISGFLLTILTRRFEFAADAFAVSLGKGALLQSSLVKLNKDNLEFPLYDPLFSMYHLSHPPLLERLDAISAAKLD